MKDKVFQSKTGTKNFLIMVLIFSGIFIFFYSITYSRWVALNLFNLLLILNLVIQTKYTVQGNFLIITSGFFLKTRIPIDAIREIEEDGKLKIAYNKFDQVKVSPKDKIEFTDYLKQLNQEIKVILKPVS